MAKRMEPGCYTAIESKACSLLNLQSSLVDFLFDSSILFFGVKM